MLRVQWGSLRRRRLHRLSSETYMWTAIGGSTAAVAPRGAVAGVLTGLDSNRTWTPAACVLGRRATATHSITNWGYEETRRGWETSRLEMLQGG